MALRYVERPLTPGADTSTSFSGSITFGLGGDDVLRNGDSTDQVVLMGGSGNDVYEVGYGSIATIGDTSGFDSIKVPFGLYDVDTYALTVNGGRHILVVNTYYETGALVLNWKDPATRIEQVAFTDYNITYDDILGLVNTSPGFLGDYTWEETEILPAGVTSADAEEAIRYYIGREAQLAASPQPTIGISPGLLSLTEGNGGAKDAIFTVTLSSASASSVTVDYTTAGIEAVQGSDFTGVTGTLVFQPGETQKTVTIAIIGDGVHEADESFAVRLSNPQNGVFAQNAGEVQARAIITNDDAVPPAAPVLDFTSGYVAANPDLFGAFGHDRAALINHYVQFGRHEGRQVAQFNVEAYAANNPDLHQAFGAEASALLNHYVQFGRHEGRQAGNFSAEAYAALNPDLLVAFGNDPAALINHYVQFGRHEGRQATGFDSEAYAALNPDLLGAFGYDPAALVNHYVQFGRQEGRQAVGFDSEAYAALNPDLFGAFGYNPVALINHYVQFGQEEGRPTGIGNPKMAGALELLGIADFSDQFIG